MAALTEARETQHRDGVLQSVKMDPEPQTIWKGGLVCRNQRGLCVSGADKRGHRFAGVAFETKIIDPADAKDGDVEVRVWRQGVFLFDCVDELIQARDIGRGVFVVDDQTVGFPGADTANFVVLCGVIVEIESAHECWIEIDGYTRAPR